MFLVEFALWVSHRWPLCRCSGAGLCMGTVRVLRWHCAGAILVLYWHWHYIGTIEVLYWDSTVTVPESCGCYTSTTTQVQHWH